MNKTVINMTNWKPCVVSGILMISGVADNHPRLGKNAAISHTSQVEKVSFDNDVITFETLNSIYICPIKYVSIDKYIIMAGGIEQVEYLGEQIANFLYAYDSILKNKNHDLSDGIKNYAEHIIELHNIGLKELEQMELEEDKRLIEEAYKYKNSLYLEVTTIHQGSKAAYNINGITGILKPYTRIETNNDYIVYHEDNLLDFKYIPEHMNIEIYERSDNIENLVIKNNKNYTITVNGRPIHPQETKIIER